MNIGEEPFYTTGWRSFSFRVIGPGFSLLEQIRFEFVSDFKADATLSLLRT